VNHFPPRIAVITYRDGSVLKVPFIIQEGLESFLALEDDVVDVELTTYTGE
jgi:hypothetical protein